MLAPVKSVSTGVVDVEVNLLVSENLQVSDNIRDYSSVRQPDSFFFKMGFQNHKFKVLKENQLCIYAARLSSIFFSE